jgi:hypothetical protein
LYVNPDRYKKLARYAQPAAEAKLTRPAGSDQGERAADPSPLGWFFDLFTASQTDSEAYRAGGHSNVDRSG